MFNPANRSVENREEAIENMGAWADYEAYLDSLLPEYDEDTETEYEDYPQYEDMDYFGMDE